MNEDKRLSNTYPDLIKEWDFEKNKDICSPDEVTYGSNVKVWWICPKGHSYSKEVQKRTLRNYNCPYCSGKRVLKGFNDLQTLRPDLIDDWNFDKNSDLLPSDITVHSNKKVWWKCHLCGYEWEAKVNDRSNGRGCPSCAGYKRIESFRKNYVQQGINDLLTLRPEIAQEWNYLKNIDVKPEDFTCNSNSKVWWKCSNCGNEWQATIANRANNNSGCPKCMRHNRTSFPEQAIYFYTKKLFPNAVNGYTELFGNSNRELDIYIPDLRIGIEYDGIAWHIDERSTRVAEEKYAVCRKHNVTLIRVSEFENIHKVFCDHHILRTENTDESLNCAINKVLSFIVNNCEIDINVNRDRNEIMKQFIISLKEKSIAARFPESICEWDIEKNNGITPEMVNSHANQKYWWRCPEGHSYRMSPGNKLYHDFGCPICSNHQILTGYNDFQTKYPQLAEQWDYEKNSPVTPSEIACGSVRKYWWKCDNNHTYQMSPYDRISLNYNCPYCDGVKVLTGFNDLMTTNPESLKYWDYEQNSAIQLFPDKILPNSGKTAYWKCSVCGYEWKKRVSIQVKSRNCPVCSNRDLLIGVNDLQAKYPSIAQEWDRNKNGDLKPNEIKYNSMKKVWWICDKCGNSWRTSINLRTAMGTGCPKCGYKNKMQETRKKTITAEKKDLVSMFPEIAQEWDYVKNEGLDPREISYGANYKVWWNCPKGHSYQAWITDRTGKRKTGCPYCSGKRIKDNLVISNPELSDSWDTAKNAPLMMEQFKKSSKRKVWWLCEKGHSFSAAICSRAKNDKPTSCPYCSNKKLLTGFNDLKSKYPVIAKEWSDKNDSLMPSDVVYGSSKKVWWKCSSCGYEWMTNVLSRTIENRGCPRCAKKKRCKKVRCVENNIIFNSVKEAAEWAGVTPSSITICLKGRIKTCAGKHWEYI